MPRRWAMVLGALPVLMLLGLWWFYTKDFGAGPRITPATMPSPQAVLDKIPEMFTDQFEGSNAVMHHVLASLRRVLIGFAIALGIVLPLGVGMGAFSSLRAAFTPMITASGYIPITTMVPLTMSWWGIDETQKCGFLALAFAIYLLPLVVKAIDAVPDVFVRTALTLGANRGQVVWRILLPIAAPDLWHAMRLAFGVGWTYIVLTEALVMVDGIGFLVAVSQRRGHYAKIYIAILIITVIAWLADLAWDRLGRLLFPYRRSR